MRFSDYSLLDVLKRNLDDAGFKRPTDIQYKAIPSILKGEDVLAIAQTGTGKTGAFAIPVLHLLLTKTRRKTKFQSPRCLVMVPTHELAEQVSEVFEDLARGTNVKILALYGGVGQEPQIEMLGRGVDVLVSTPGRMFDLRSQGVLDLSFVEILILDEADHMLDMGFIHDIRQLIRYLPKKKQTLFFSATIDEQIKKIAYSLVHKPIRIQISPKDPVSQNVDHCVFYLEMDEKRFYLEKLIRQHAPGKILVFVRTRVRAERVAKAMKRVNIESLLMHGDLDQSERARSLNQFKQGLVPVMISTDVSGRGIDIPEVVLVVNYDLPDEMEYYVHRVGRTGRGENKGLAISFCSPQEVPILQKIEAWLGKPIEILKLSKHERDDIISESVENKNDLQKLMREIEEIEAKKKTKKRK
ncbi:MAG: DEAD/DEAH box helicase [Saprospiraceae bacterium]|nr:DEAD/DEAH box helicase [Saprospiraceae bacterium]